MARPFNLLLQPLHVPEPLVIATCAVRARAMHGKDLSVTTEAGDRTHPCCVRGAERISRGSCLLRDMM